MLITVITKCHKPTRLNKLVLRAYKVNQLLCPLECINCCLKIRAHLVDTSLTKFFIAYRKPPHSMSKKTLPYCVKEVIYSFEKILPYCVKEVTYSFGIDTSVFKSHNLHKMSIK